MTLIVWNFSTKTYFSRLRLFCAVPQLHISNDNSAGCEGLGVVAKIKQKKAQMHKKLLQVPDKVKKLVLGWLSHIVFLHFSNDVDQHPDHQNQTRPRKQSKVKEILGHIMF